MIIKVNRNEKETLLLHLIKLEFNYPKQEPNAIGTLTLADVYKSDAELLAKRIKAHLEKRTTIKSASISTPYASITFTAITPDSMFCSVIGNEPDERITVDYMVGSVDPDTGKEERETKFTVSELGWYEKSGSVGITFLHNYYKSIYLLEIADEMRAKNPGGYLTLKNNSAQIGTLPAIAANLNEQIVGSSGINGLYMSNVYPIPGSAIEILSVDQYPHLSYLKNDEIEAKVKKLIIDNPNLDVSSVVQQVRDSELGTVDNGLNFVYNVTFMGTSINITERLFNHMLGRRQDLIWCFSELSRCFEMAGVINTDHIGRNLRTFQNRLKTLLNGDMTLTLYPENSPRDLEDLVIQLFPSTHRPIYKLIKEVDPSRVLYGFELVSGSQDLFNKIKNTNKFLSPGLIASIPYYLNNFRPVNIDEDLAFSYIEDSKQVVFKLIPLTDHSSDKLSFQEFKSVLDSSMDDYMSLLNIVFWLNSETKDEFLIDISNPKSMKIITPNHLLRKYSGLPIFDGFLKAKVLRGFF